MATRTRWGRLGLVIGLAAVLGGGLAWRSFVRSPPAAPSAGCPGCNLVIVVLDAARADRMSLYGHSRSTTPVIDRFAREALVFEHAYSEASYTLPSVASLFTGLPPEAHRVTTVKTPLAPEAVTVAEILADRGHRTGAFCENPLLEPAHGLAQGFGEFRTLGRSIGAGPSRDYDVSASRDHVAEALDWARRDGGAPFFLYLHLLRPHAPYRPLPEHAGRFARPYSGTLTGASRDLIELQYHGRAAGPDDVAHLADLYDENLLSADALVGDLLGGLGAAGVLDSTVVVIVGDHGEELREHGNLLHGIQVYEESIRVPMLLRLPPRMGIGGRRIDTPVQLADVAPTVVRLIAGDGGPALPGTDLLELADPGDPGSRPIVSRSTPAFAAVALREHGLKYIEVRPARGAPRAMLFDLETDPGERSDLATRRPGDVATLSGRLKALEADRASEAVDGTPSRAVSPEVRDVLEALGYVE